ncbi:MAG TPA: hypothetical protein VGX48_21750 [Pyrinomonadaceae bacterium]|nr:hypothetical protein [Pyrinomonadaceae bacterium]
MPWPPCEEVQDVYKIDRDVCETAKQLWTVEGEPFCLAEIGDAAEGLDLMLAAAASVARFRAAYPDRRIENLKAYLRTAFRRLILEERRRKKRHLTLVDELPKNGGGEQRPQGFALIAVEGSQEKDALIAQVKRHMKAIDPRFLEVHEYREMGYTFERLARHYGMKPNHLRSWYSKKWNCLVKRLRKG